ncbi:LysR family transcriptional regulator [Actinokineospora diospyrosa]|uniref:DNA-binding transcriptional regulator, LysR family n=1 Tax=Actinokineospora diospyrosa TaxID=103728 RepID=A0ABT1IMH6_9PSEU|nr:LysR family transcriptional regulator [Actinokineospora diospyrosa]MCP2273872.1 DNA-binding transcriptional regulator, LysR family [Actinokineospora diospyrosa]
MTNSLDLEHLRTLVAIAECGGFSKAAAVRHISQPALSQHVRLLERGLKRKLFERDGRNMRFTHEGEQVLAEARRIIEVHDASLRRLAARPSRSIVVGSTEHSAGQILPEMIRALQAAFPDCSTRFEIGRSTQLAESVGKGTVDFAFVLDPSGQGAGHLVGKLPLVWYAARGWQPPAPGETWPLIAFEEPCGLRERAMSLLAGEGRQVEVTAQSTTLEGVLAGVRAGLGVALLPSGGGRPTGLTVCSELPDGGTTQLRLVVRRGLNAEIEQTALAAGMDFFAQRPHLQLVPAAQGA